MKNIPSTFPALPDGVELIDTHCHLDMDAYRHDLDAVIQSATDHGVRRIITIGIDAASSQKAVAIAERSKDIHATIGFHPHNALQATPEALQELALLADRKVVVGYGEIGLDYVKNYAPARYRSTPSGNSFTWPGNSTCR
jgi:TatD DNase family protein